MSTIVEEKKRKVIKRKASSQEQQGEKRVAITEVLPSTNTKTKPRQVSHTPSEANGISFAWQLSGA
jgi:hypothetical protein